MSKEKFDMTQEHLDLLKHMYITFYDEMYMGSPSVDIKRPFGNKSVLEDMARILKMELFLDKNEEETLTSKQAKYLENLWYNEMETALQIVLCTQSFKTGHYVMSEEYHALSWILNEPYKTHPNT
jgi:hypothetical protein